MTRMVQVGPLQHAIHLSWTTERTHLTLRGAGKKVKIAILSDTGRGDVARALCLAGPLRAEGGAGVFIVLYHLWDNTMPKWDMAAHAQRCGMIDAHISMHPVPRPKLINVLRERFDVVYDAMPIPVGVYCKGSKAGMKAAQAEADQRLKPWANVYSAHPLEGYSLASAGMQWWDIMSATTGLDVKPLDLALAAPVECAPWPEHDEIPPGNDLAGLQVNSGSDNYAAAEFKTQGDYVVIHAGTGPGSVNKLPTVAWFEAIVAGLKAERIQCVQVGMAGETHIKGAADKLGYRLPVTNRIMQGALALIDSEGFLNYQAFGLGVPSIVAFGPTPESLYALPGNLNLKAMTAAGRPFCAMGTCFWGGPGTACKTQWAERCWLGEANPTWNPKTGNAVCVNIPQSSWALAQIVPFLATCKERKAGRARA